MWVKCVLVRYSQPLTSIFGLVNSSVMKIRLECRLHPSHSMGLIHKIQIAWKSIDFGCRFRFPTLVPVTLVLGCQQSFVQTWILFQITSYISNAENSKKWILDWPDKQLLYSCSFYLFNMHVLFIIIRHKKV